MNSLRIRSVKFDEVYNKDEALKAKPFGVQVSQCGLVWWTIGRYETLEQAKQVAKAVELCVKQNQISKPSHVFTSTQI